MALSLGKAHGKNRAKSRGERAVRARKLNCESSEDCHHLDEHEKLLCSMRCLSGAGRAELNARARLCGQSPLTDALLAVQGSAMRIPTVRETVRLHPTQAPQPMRCLLSRVACPTSQPWPIGLRPLVSWLIAQA